MHKILLVYIEPTPYIIGLIKNITKKLSGHVDILFLQENVSQNWNLELAANWKVFPPQKNQQMLFVLSLLKNQRYDLIHLAGWNEPIFLFMLFLAKIYRVPVSIESDTPPPFRIQMWKRLIKRLIYPRLFSLVNLFLAGGKLQAQYINQFGVNLNRIIPVQMTVDVTNIQRYTRSLTESNKAAIRQSLGIPAKAVIFLYVGRLEIHKGIVDLLSAFQMSKNEDRVLLFVGDGSLRQLVENHVKANKQIYFAGRLVNESLMTAYYAADVVVLPSHFEPWGLVVNEAMAAGKPVIISDRVGCRADLVTDDTGIVFPAENVTELNAAMQKLENDLDKRQKMGKQASKIIASWTLENEAENICNAWQKILPI